MTTSYRLLIFLAAATALALAQPAINNAGVQNAAGALQGTPNLNLAPGAIVSITGQNLGSFQTVKGDPNNPSTQLGGVSVQISSGGYSNNAVILYASASEVDVILPPDVPMGTAGITVTYNNQAGNTVNVAVAPASFSAFTMDTQDNASAVWQSFVSRATIPINNLGAQAQAGQSLTLVGTGLGGTTDVTVLVGNTPAQVTAAGPEDCCSGLDRIVFTVPPNADGCVIGVQVTTGQVTNVVAPISVTTDGRFCPDQSGFSPDDVAKAKANGSIKVGYLFLLRFSAAGPAGGFGGPVANSEIDFGFAEFSKVSYDEMVSFRGLTNQSIPGACWGGNTNSQQFAQTGAPGFDFFANFYPFGDTPLDAGSNVHLSGAGSSQTMTQLAPGAYYGTFFNTANPLNSFLQPGNYTFDNGGGGGDVPGFSSSVKVNPTITFAGTNAINTVDRSKDLTIQWTGGGTDDRVLAIVYAGQYNFASGGLPVVGIAACVQLAANKQITIPAAYLSALPATGSSPTSGQGLILLYSEQLPARTQPSNGLDAVYMMTLGYTAQPVQVQ